MLKSPAVMGVSIGVRRPPRSSALQELRERHWSELNLSFSSDNWRDMRASLRRARSPPLWIRRVSPSCVCHRQASACQCKAERVCRRRSRRDLRVAAPRFPSRSMHPSRVRNEEGSAEAKDLPVERRVDNPGMSRPRAECGRRVASVRGLKADRTRALQSRRSRLHQGTEPSNTPPETVRAVRMRRLSSPNVHEGARPMQPESHL